MRPSLRARLQTLLHVVALHPRIALTGLVLALFSFTALPLVFSTNDGGYAWDETEYHLPTIRAIDAHWPHLDLVHDCKAAIAPGYPYLLASIAQITTTDRTILRCVNFLISLLGLVYLARRLQGIDAGTAAAALACLAGSSFFLKSAGWILTDNAALIMMMVVLHRLLERATPGSTGGATWATAAGIFMRQNYAWMMVPLALGQLRIATPPGKTPLERLTALGPLLLPLGVLGWLVLTWKGLVPPAWHAQHYVEGWVTPSGVIYSLALLGLYAGPFLFAIGWRPRRQNLLRRSALLAVGAVALLFAATPMTPDESAGRWGGYLWMAASALPPGSASLLFLAMASVGALMLVELFGELQRRRDTMTAAIWLAAYVAWLAASLPNRQIFQRYFEPPTLVFLLAWLVACAPQTVGRRRLPLIGFALIQFGLSAFLFCRMPQ